MNPFESHLPTHLYVGEEKMEPFFNHVARLGRSALVVIGGGTVERIGLLSIVERELSLRGVASTVFKGIEPNPVDRTVDAAAAMGLREKADLVLAVGGGSVMDAGKAIAALIHDGEPEIWPFVLGEPRHRQLKGALPIATIPTTAATASEITPYSVISKPEIHGKSTLAYPFFKPAASWLNPAIHVHLPAATTADGAADIMSHVFENYLLGGDGALLTDRYCEAIFTTVVDILPRLLSRPDDIGLRGEMQWASTLALNGMQSAGRLPSPAPLHALEHAMSGYQPSLAHGRGLATLYPAYFRFLMDRGRAVGRIARFGREVFGVAESDDLTAASAGLERFETWLRDVGLYQSVRELGIPESAYGAIADYTVKIYGDGERLDVAGPMDRDDIVALFKDTHRQEVR